jgi:hypothetical protein
VAARPIVVIHCDDRSFPKLALPSTTLLRLAEDVHMELVVKKNAFAEPGQTG